MRETAQANHERLMREIPSDELAELLASVDSPLVADAEAVKFWDELMKPDIGDE